MNLGDIIGLIIKESFSSPIKNSYVTTVNDKKVVLREGGKYKEIDLRGANLINAHLKNIDLEGADLTGADLTGACLRGANLKKVKFKETVISGADFTNALIENKELMGVKAAVDPIGIKIAKRQG